MGYLRPLGDIERGCWLIDQTAPMNVVAIAALRGRLDLLRLRDALARVQRRHPLLRVSVQIDRAGPAFFASDHAIPVEVIERRTPSHWMQIATDERNRAIAWDVPPLLRLSVLRGDDESELVMTMHHIISDGASASYLIRDLLRAYADRSTSVELAPLDLRPAIEALMPESERGLAGLKRSARFIGQQAWTYFARRPQLLREQESVPSAQRQSTFAHQVLSQVETHALLAACRGHSVSVHSALCAALLRAVRAEIQADTHVGEMLLGCCTPVNLRAALRPAVGEDLGLYVGPIVTFHQLSAGTELFALAAELTTQIQAARTAGIPTLALATQGRLLPARISPQRAAQHLYNRLFGTVSVSNMG
ncbi:MAG TPA: condensation domain-containing protein, partial [Pseudomonadota bacterium]|nr:condensation domain-containing protein [Pseudomonadota bacterium]